MIIEASALRRLSGYMLLYQRRITSSQQPTPEELEFNRVDSAIHKLLEEDD